MSSFRKLSCKLTLILTLFYLPPTARAATMQAPEWASEQTDAALAKYYQKVYGSGGDSKLELLAHAKGLKPGQGLTTVQGREESLPHGSTWTQSRAVSPNDDLPPTWRAAINSDLVVLGTPLQSRSVFIEDHSFLFTEYAVKVEKVFAPEHSSVLSGDTIIVSRPGGQMVIDNVPMGAIDPAYTQFPLNQQYVFMLEAVPGSGAYRAYAARTFIVRDGQVFSISQREKSTPPKKLPNFLADLNAALERKRTIVEFRRQ
jgi:hypothetical protein